MLCKLHIPHFHKPSSLNLYLVHKSTVRSIVAGCIGTHLVRGKVKFEEIISHFLPFFREKRFTCDVGLCRASYVHNKDLKAHKEAKHQNKSYKCEKCDKEFLYVQGLNKHVAACHNGRVFAYATHNKEYTAQSSLKRHLTKTHN